MKGLLVKDFKLLGLQKNFLFMMTVIAAGAAVVNEDVMFMLGYMTFVMSIFALSTISYDEFDNGNAFLFTLPVSRKDYVVEKYGFCALLGAGGWGFAVLTALILSLIKGALPVLDVIMPAFMLFPIMLLIQAVMAPFMLKFGGEKGRIAMVGAVGILAIIGFFVEKAAKMLGFDLPGIINNLPMVSMGKLVVIAVIAAVVIFFISMKISISIMEKKQF